MDDRTFISLNVTNTLTVFVMVALGYGLVVLATQGWKNWFSGGASQGG